MLAPGRKNIALILVRPEFLGNIGSTARLMKNFGFTDLRLVNAPRNYKDAEARKMAVGAFDVLKVSSTFSTLAEAIADLHFVIGTSSGHQRAQTEPPVPLEAALELAGSSARNGRIGFVFGDERNGLRNEELSLCHVVATIPTNPDFPSLNLAQAACIVAYEWSKYVDEEVVTDEPVQVSPTVEEVTELFCQMDLLLENAEFARKYNKTKVLAEFRSFFLKARPTKRECDLLRGVLHKLNQKLNVV